MKIQMLLIKMTLMVIQTFITLVMMIEGRRILEIKMMKDDGDDGNSDENDGDDDDNDRLLCKIRSHTGSKHLKGNRGLVFITQWHIWNIIAAMMMRIMLMTTMMMMMMMVMKMVMMVMYVDVC